MNITVSEGQVDTHTATHKHLVCWRSTIAGFFISMMVFAGFLALVIAFGGIGLSDGSSVKNATVFSVISFMVAIIVSVFAGSYFSVRVARFQSHVVGSAQGLVVAALSIAAAIWLAVATVGTVGKVVGNVTGVSSESAMLDAQNPMVVDFVEDNIGAAKLKSDSTFVAAGLSRRLIRSDMEGSRNFLMRHSSLSYIEADARIGVLNQRVYEMLNAGRDDAATALMTSGWSLFLMVALAAMSAALGGLLGATINLRQPLDFVEPAYLTKKSRLSGAFQPAR